MYNPWHDLRDRPDVTLHWRIMPVGLDGVTDGVSQIWIDPRLLRVEMWCVLTHELIHLDRHDQGCQAPKLEARIRRTAARRLIPLPRLLDTARWAHDADEAADHLHVTIDTLMTRIDSLSAHERQMLEQVIRQHP